MCVYVCIRLHLNFSRADMLYGCSPYGMLCNPIVNWWARPPGDILTKPIKFMCDEYITWR